jgi:hypothetical protein
MHRFTRRNAIVVLPALLIALGTGAVVALPAQAASAWSAPAPLPAGAGSQQFAENAAGAQVVTWSTYNESTFLTSVEVSTSANGLTWSAPVTLTTSSDAGPAPAAAIAPNGRVVVAWLGGPATASVIQSSVLPPGGTWSAPVNVSTDAFGGPVIGMDGSGNAIVAWLGAGREIRTASLPATSTTWTAVDTLDTALAGFALNMAVSSNGSVLVTWVEALRTVWADSGTVLGGFAAPVTIDSVATSASRTGSHAVQATLDAYQSPGVNGDTQVPSVYFVGHTQVLLSNSGIAELQWGAPGSSGTAIRSAAGTWSIQAVPGSVAIDGAGDILSVTQQTSASGVTSVYTSKLPAGSSTWSTPAALAVGSSPVAAGDAAGTFVVALQTASGPSAYTSPPGGSFGAAATFPAADGVSALMVDPGHAVLILNSSAVSTEPVS